MIGKVSSYVSVVLFTTLISTNSHALFGLGYGNNQDFHMVVHGNKIEFGQSPASIEAKIGKPSNSEDGLFIWRFDSGLSFSAGFDKDGLNDASISSSQSLTDSYAVVFDRKMYLNNSSIESLENTYKNQRYCLSYYEANKMLTDDTAESSQEVLTPESDAEAKTNEQPTIDVADFADDINNSNLGWLDFQLTDTHNAANFAVFSAVSYSAHSLSSYEGQLTARSAIVDNISISKNLQTFNKNIYCSP